MMKLKKKINLTKRPETKIKKVSTKLEKKITNQGIKR
jgi:hypothetical protein